MLKLNNMKKEENVKTPAPDKVYKEGFPGIEDDETAGTNITPDELQLLDTAGEDDEERRLHSAETDATDADGDGLNEESDLSGDDLDVPGTEADDDNEDIGEEDEENNAYSRKDMDWAGIFGTVLLGI